MVVHPYNPKIWGGIGKKIRSSKPSSATVLKKTSLGDPRLSQKIKTGPGRWLITVEVLAAKPET